MRGCLAPGLLLLLAVALGGCGSIHESPQTFAAYQRRHHAYLDAMYPPGTPREQNRAEVADGTVSRRSGHDLREAGAFDLATIGPPPVTKAEAKAEPWDRKHLRFYVEVAEMQTGQRPRYADRFESYRITGFLGMGWILDYHWVLYDERERVLVSYAQHLD